MTQKKYTEIPNRQKCINKEHPYIGGAVDIYDDTLEKPQSEVNQDMIQETGTLDGKIATEKERAEGVEAGLRESIDELGTIGVDPENAISTSGADFKGETLEKRSKIPTIGAIINGINDVYDVTANNSGAIFASLSALLSDANINTLIPPERRKGGMILQFIEGTVQSSDNNYVQFRYMGTSTANADFTNVANWQGVDEEPTADSKNLITSGGVKNAVSKLNYYVASLDGYIKISDGSYQSGAYYLHKSTDYIPISKGDTVYIADTVTVGGVATKGAYYTSNQGDNYQSISNGFVAPNDGYVRFCCQTATITNTSFGIYINNFTGIFASIDELNNALTELSSHVITQPTTNGNTQNGITGWNSYLATKSFDSEDSAMLVTGDGAQYGGVLLNEENPDPSIPRVVIFQAKRVSGDCSNIGVSYRTYPLPAENKISLSDNWETYIIQMPTNGTNKTMSIITYSAAAFSMKVKNFYFADFPDYDYTVLSTLGNLLSDYNGLKDRGNKNPLTDAVDRRYIDNALSDFGLPSWVGKIEKRTSDLMPSINNAGAAYTIDNNGTLELRIVKDATTIVGCALTQKAENQITAKTFSMCHFGDSITYGVGSNPNFVQRLKTLLEADGHTVTTQTNLGVSGATAESTYNSYKNTTPVHHDFATFMIGINDQDRWLTVKNTEWETVGLKADEFRDWYRTYLRLSIDMILDYSTCTKLFLIVPYWSVVEMRNGEPWPSEGAYYSQPLQNIVIQEVISAAEDYNNIWLCRADYYVPNSTAYIPDGLHANNNGAQLLAEGVRNEMTFRV